MKRFITSAILALGLIMASIPAMAHTPLCDCFDNGDGTVTCEGGFSDGSSAAGVAMEVLDGSGAVVLSGAMDGTSTFEFEKPAGDYQVRFDAGEGHSIVINGADIVE